ncbi:peptide chain release factor aRF-1 [Nanoarchaeota archaeon]
MQKISSRERHKLKQLVKELESIRGRHTELVTVYVPSGYSMVNIINHLQEEQSTASNIKSKQTKENVIGALERMIRHLQLFKQTPPNGLAVFAGNVSEKEGQQKLEVWSIEPPVPLDQRLYRCDKQFVLEPLRDIADDETVYGMLVIDKREADIAMLKGKTIIPITKSTSNVPGKTRAGGQSAARFERLREGAAKDFYRKVANHFKDAFHTNKDIKGILVGGPGNTKHDWLDQSQLPEDLKKKIITMKDLSYTGDFGLQELLDRCEDVLAEEEVIEEKKIMQKFFNHLAKQPGMVEYGKDAVMKKLEMGTVDKLLLSEEMDDKTITEFEKAAEKMKSDVIIISPATREGAQLVDLGMVAAILRYDAGNQ